MGNKTVPEDSVGGSFAFDQEYIQSFQKTEVTRTQNLQEICRFLEQVCEDAAYRFVHGRGERKSRNRNI